jgi:type I restriction enzyme S subunit
MPEHWKVRRFKWIIERNDGGVWGEDPDGEADTLVLRSTEQTVDGRWKIDDPARRKLTSIEKQSSLLETGDLLVTKSSGSSLHIGKTTLVDEQIASLSCCYSNFMQRIRLTDALRPKLAWYVMNNELARLQFDLLSNSTTGLANLNGTMIAEILVPIASQEEQLCIEFFLDRETAKIDALIAEQETLLALLAERRQATISHAVTRGLDPDVPMQDSGIAWLGEVPAHWEVQRVKNVAQLESGHTPSKQVPEYWENCDINWVSLNDSKQLAANDYIGETAVKISELGLSNSSARLLPAGAVVFTRDAAIGLAAITAVPMAVSQHLIAWCPSERISSLFLLRVFNAMKPHLDAYTFGATIKTIGMDDVRELVSPVPPLEEQALIVSHIESETTRLDKLASSARLARELLKERRSALIAAAVTGKIDVRGLVEAQAA